MNFLFRPTYQEGYAPEFVIFTLTSVIAFLCLILIISPVAIYALYELDVSPNAT